jgi:hypothetical protein
VEAFWPLHVIAFRSPSPEPEVFEQNYNYLFKNMSYEKPNEDELVDEMNAAI